MSEQKEVLLSDDAAVERAQVLRKAMKGFGTDEKALADVLAPLTPAQAFQVNEAYTATINRDLVKDLKSELGGKLEDAMVALAQPAGLCLATQIRGAIKGLGTDEDVLIEAVCNATEDDLKAANFWYRKSFERIMIDEVEGDVGGKLGDLLSRVIRGSLEGRPSPGDDKLEEDVLRLYRAGEGKIGKDSKVFIDIIGGNSREYVSRLAGAYAKKHGKSLVKVIRDEFGGDMEKALLSLVQEPHVTYSAILHKSMKGLGTDEKTLVRVVCSQRARMADIAAHFLSQHEKTLERWVASELSGDLKYTLVKVVQVHGG